MGNYRHKILVERAMQRLDERTPMDARTDSRFTQKPTTKVPDMIQNKAVTAVYAVDKYDHNMRKEIVKKALDGYRYEYITVPDEEHVLVRNLVYCELPRDGIVNDKTIFSRFKRALIKKIKEFNNSPNRVGYYVISYFEEFTNEDMGYSDISAYLTIIFRPRKTGIDPATKEGQLEGLKVYNQIVSELKSHIEGLTTVVGEFADEWDKAYRRTWSKDESIAYADLPWADKTHKILVERAMQRLDERTPMDARTDSRFTQKPTTKVPDMIQNKAVTAVYAVDKYDHNMRKEIVKKALDGYRYEYITVPDEEHVLVRNLVYCELPRDGIVNDKTIFSRFKRALIKKIKEFNNSPNRVGYYVISYFEEFTNEDMGYSDISAYLTIIFRPRKTGIDPATKEGQLEGLKVYNQIVSELKSHIEGLTTVVGEFADEWDKAYRRTWSKDESIAYADLPWADKTHTTVNEGIDSQKLFGNNKRLNEAIDRMFEDAVEIGANLTTEEEMMSKFIPKTR